MTAVIFAALLQAAPGAAEGNSARAHPISAAEAVGPFRRAGFELLPDLFRTGPARSADWSIDKSHGLPCGKLTVFESVRAAQRTIRSWRFLPPATFRIANVVFEGTTFCPESHRRLMQALNTLGKPVRIG